MTKQLINTGQTSNDGTGDTLRQGALKVNANFNEIYLAIGDGLRLNPPNQTGFALTAGISTNSQKFNGQLPSYYLDYTNLTNTPTALSSFTNDVGFITSVVGASGFVAGGIVTATSFYGDGSSLTGIASAVDTGALQAQINSLGTNLNIVGFYDAVAGIVTALTVVGQGRTYTGIGQTLSSVGIVTGDYFIVARGGSNVGIATFTNPGISSVYSGDWIVGVGGESWSILSYSQQVTAPKATLADEAVTLQNNSNVNTSGVITASQYFGNAGAMTNLTGASFGTYGNSSTVPQVNVDATGKITGITNVAIAFTDIAAGLGTGYWSKEVTGIHTTSNVGIGTTAGPSGVRVHGDVEITATSGGALRIYNARKAIFGNSENAHITFDGADFKIKSDHDTQIVDENDNKLAVFKPGGSVELYQNGTKRLDTVSLGVTVYGAYYGDGSRLAGIVTNLVAGENIELSQNGTEVTVTSTAAGGIWQNSGYPGVVGIGTTAKVGVGTTAPDISKIFTAKGNANITGSFDVGPTNIVGVVTVSTGRIQTPTGANIKIGNLPMSTGGGGFNIGIGEQVLAVMNGGDGRNIGIGNLALYSVTNGQYNIALGERAGRQITQGSYNVLIGKYEGINDDLDIRSSSNNIVLSDGAGNIRQYINSSGDVGIKTTVITEALTVAGVVSATSFYGSLNASQLTGSMPAIDGSQLIGVVASGTGIVIRNSGNNIGVAATINFDANLNASFSAGVCTVTGNTEFWRETGVGIHTFKNIGIGTTNPVYPLTVEGAADIRGNLRVNNQYLELSSTGWIRHDDQSQDQMIFQINTGTDSPGVDGSFIFRSTDPGIPSVQKDALRIYSAGSSPDRLVRIYRNLQVDAGATIAETLSVGSAVTSSPAGVNVTGVITSTTFEGSASGLTDIPAGQLTGSMPAIDGSNLLNVNATGSGIVCEDDDINVGSARTVNFGDGLDVTYSATGIATITASGGSLQTREVVVGTTTAIPNNGIGNTDITGFKSYGLMKVGLSTAGWLRIYTDSASRAADINRGIGEDPAQGSGVIAEFVSTGINTTSIISPFVMGGNLDEPASTTIYVSIKNLTGYTNSISANLTILQLEA